MTSVLSLTQASYYQTGIALLSNINFSVDKSQIIGLLGVNGAGKSTALKLAAGILLPTTGKVTYYHQPTIGYVPEHAPLMPRWTVLELLHHACKLHQLPAANHETAIARVLLVCDLNAVKQQETTTLSKGNQQRVNIAQALLQEPDLLILDEPTSGLDPQQIHQFRQLLRRIRSQTAILFSSHIMQEITDLCDKIIILHEGKQLQQLNVNDYRQTVEVTFAKPVSPDCFSVLPSWQNGSQLKHYFLIKTPDEQRQLINFCQQHDLLINRIRGSEQILENEFLARIKSSDTQSVAGLSHV